MSFGDYKKSETSASDEWETPASLITAIEEEYGPIVLDVAATPENAKGPYYFTKETNALDRDWNVSCGDREGVIFWNPPYSKPNKPSFARKAFEVAAAGKRQVVGVIPANMRDVWFHDLYLKHFDVSANRYQFDGELSGWCVQGTNYLEGQRDKPVWQELTFLRGSVHFWSPLNPKNNGTPGGVVVIAQNFLP
jgi:phage N-6-adenine-methyltransferase